MTERPQRRIENNREKIQHSDQLDERDQDLLQEFDRQLALRQYSDARHLKLIRHCRVLAGHVETSVGPDETPEPALADALEDRDAAEEIVHWIHTEYDNEETNRDMRVALRMFGKLVTDGDEIPGELSWIPSTTSRSYNPTPDPADMLDWDGDVIPMIQHAYNPRDKALLAVAWDAGLRGGELHDLSIGDVSDHDHGLQLHVDGKQGQRTVTLFVAGGHLSTWLDAHPASDDSTAPLWCLLSDGKSQISYQRLGDVVHECADRADMEKPATITNFRKSSASHLASQGVSQSILEEHHGWARGSDVAGRYIAVFADASDREIAAAHGLDIKTEDDEQSIASIKCPRCGELTPQSRACCLHCQQAIRPEATEVIDDIKDAADRILVDADSKQEREDAITIRNAVDDNPGRFEMDDLHDLASSLSSSDSA
jgi:hypothetical protein